MHYSFINTSVEVYNVKYSMKKVLSLIMVFVAAVMWSTPGFSGNAYVSGNIGLSWMNDVEFSSNWTDDSDGFTIGTGSGLAVSGAAGYDFGDYRTELELGYQTNDVESWQETDENYTGSEYDSTGDISLVSVMVNGAYDICLGSDVELSPYAGIGAAFISFDDVSACFNYEDSYRDKTAASFAYQLGAALSLPASDDIMVECRYRYFGTSDFSFDRPDAQADLSSHSAMLGMRVAL